MTLEKIQIETGTNCQSSIIWLHGLGADGHDFEDVVPMLNLPKQAAIRFVFPHAPHVPLTLQGKIPMRAWYDLTSWDFNHEQDTQGMAISIEKINELVELEIKKGIEPKNIFLAGFSQGGAIALQTALNSRRRLAGVIGLSTYLPIQFQFKLSKHIELPIFLAHGTEDPIIPFSLSELTKRRLDKEGYQPVFNCYPMPHCVCEAEIKALGIWISTKLSL